MQLVLRLWNDEAGFILSAEALLIATILVLGMIVGLATIRDSLVQELADFAAAIGSVNQSFSFSAVTGHHSSTAGSFFEDNTDDCDSGSIDPIGSEAQCVEVCNTNATPE